MGQDKRDFDKEAATWENPPRVKLAEDVSLAIARHVPLALDMDLLDFGCGTGLVSLALRSKVRSVTGVDTSRGMLDVFNEKVSRGGILNAKTFHLDPERGEPLPGEYGSIVMSMTLHHVKDVRALLDKLYAAMLPGAYHAIADLDTEGGSFHANHDGVFHHGFDREALRRILADAGLVDIKCVSAAEMVKPAADGSTRGFSVFLMTGRKLPASGAASFSLEIVDK